MNDDDNDDAVFCRRFLIFSFVVVVVETKSCVAIARTLLCRIFLVNECCNNGE
jgi:hypothetical protein